MQAAFSKMEHVFLYLGCMGLSGQLKSFENIALITFNKGDIMLYKYVF